MQKGISKSFFKKKKESALIMRKQTKLVAVLSTAALLAIGASMTSFAAVGWAEEDGTWVSSNRDTNKSRVPNTFWTPSSFIAYQTLFRLTILLYIHLNGCRIYSCRIIKSGTTIYHMFESKLYFSLKCFFTIDNQSDFLIQID